MRYFALIACLLYAAVSATAQPQFFTVDVQSDELVTIESGPNGQAILQVVGPLGVDLPLDVDLEWHNGQLLALTAGNGSAGTCQLFDIDPTTATATLLATLAESDGGGIARAEALVSMPGRGLVVAYGPPASLAFSRQLGTLQIDGTVDPILDLEQFRTGADADALAVIGPDRLVSIDNFYFTNQITDFLRVETIDLLSEDLSTRFEVNQGPGGMFFTVVSDLARSPGGLLVALLRTGTRVLDLENDEFLPGLSLPGTSPSVIRYVGLAEIEDPDCTNAIDLAEPFGILDAADITELLTRLDAGDPSADWDGSGVLDFFDVTAFLNDYDACDSGAQEIVLRDSIGPDNSMTNFNYYFPTGSIAGTAIWGVTAIELQAPVDVTLTEVAVVMTGLGFTFDFDAFAYELRVWPELSDAELDPRCLGADCVPFFFAQPTIGPTGFGTTAVTPVGERATYLLVFDVRAQGITLTAGETMALGITALSPGGPAGNAAVVESEEPGLLTDQFGQAANGWFFTSDIPSRQHDGRLGIRVIAESSGQ